MAPKRRFPLFVFLTTIAILAAYSAPGSQLQPSHSYRTADIVVKNIPYVKGMEKNRNLMLDVFYNRHEGPAPMVVVIHGGAYFKDSKEMENYIFLSHTLANNGYVVFNINYRLVPAVRLKTQAEDAMGAVIWAKVHASEYGGDPDRVAVLGGSSGGHMAALIAWAANDPYFSPTGADENGPGYGVDAAALYYPVLDFDRTIRDNASILHPLAHLIITGKAGKKYRRDLEKISPMKRLNKNSSPTIFLTGDKDSLKLYPQSVEGYESMKALGIPTALYTAKGKDHGFTWQYWEPETTEAVEMTLKFFGENIR